MNTSTPDIIKRIVDGTSTQTTTPAEVLTAPPVAKPVIEEKQAKPPMYAVILHNDATTEGGFVTQVLREAFSVEGVRARQIMMAAHRNGQAVVQILSKEVAETRVENAKALISKARPGLDHVNEGGDCQLQFSCEPETSGE